MKTDTNLDRILRTASAAEFLALSTSTLEKWRLTGNGPRFVRLGGRSVGYRLSDLGRWIDSERRKTVTGRAVETTQTRVGRS